MFCPDSSEVKAIQMLLRKFYPKSSFVPTTAGKDSKKIIIDSDKMNNSNESDKLWNILLINSILEHNNKNNKQKYKIISDKILYKE